MEALTGILRGMSTARIPFTPEDEGAIKTLTGTMLFLLILNFLFGALGLLGGCFSFIGVPTQLAIHPMAGVGTALTAMTLTVYCAGMVAQAALLFIQFPHFLLADRQALQFVALKLQQFQARVAVAGGGLQFLQAAADVVVAQIEFG